MITVVVALSILCGFVAAIIAQARSANGLTAFLAGILLGPIGVLIAFGMPSYRGSADPSGLPPGLRRECPFCKSQIDRDATVCKFCQRASDAVLSSAGSTCKSGRAHKWEDSTLYPHYIVCSRCEVYAKERLSV